MDYQKFRNFIRYDNTAPLFLMFVFIGSSSAFALTNETVQNALVSTTQTVLSVDNTYIANTDLTNYSPKVTISGVQEDSDAYIVTYNFQTIELINAVWQPTTISRELKVDKKVLGQYKDLGLFVTEELKQVIDAEKQRLLATQEIEKKNISQKVVATEYSGLIGKLMDENTEVLPGYVPVVNEIQTSEITPTNQPPIADEKKLAELHPFVPATTTETVSTTTPVTPETGATTTTPIENNVNVQLVGNATENIFVGETYTDKGVFVNNATTNSILTKVNDVEVTTVSIDTTVTGTFTITYKVDTDKGVFDLTRTVNVATKPVDVPVETPVETPVEVPVQEEVQPVTPVVPETPAPSPEPVAEPVVETPVTPAVPPAEAPAPVTTE